MGTLIRHLSRISRRITAPNTINLLTLTQLNRALSAVWNEMSALGFANKGVDRVPPNRPAGPIIVETQRRPTGPVH